MSGRKILSNATYTRGSLLCCQPRGFRVREWSALLSELPSLKTQGANFDSDQKWTTRRAQNVECDQDPRARPQNIPCICATCCYPQHRPSTLKARARPQYPRSGLKYSAALTSLQSLATQTNLLMDALACVALAQSANSDASGSGYRLLVPGFSIPGSRAAGH